MQSISVVVKSERMIKYERLERDLKILKLEERVELLTQIDEITKGEVQAVMNVFVILTRMRIEKLTEFEETNCLPGTSVVGQLIGGSSCG